MRPRAADREVASVPGATHLGNRHHPLCAEEGPGDRAGFREHILDRPVGDDLAAVLPCPGPDVDDPVGRPDRLFVVLDDEDRVAEVPQSRQRGDQLGVVPLVQADRRLIEDVEHAHEGRPDLGREPDPLCLAAGQGLARPIDGQVVEPDIHEEPEACTDLLEQLVGDGPLSLRDPVCEILGPGEGIRDREIGHGRDIAPVHGHGQCLGAQSLAVALRAGLLDHVFLEFVLDELGFGLPVPSLKVGDGTFERGHVRVLAAFVLVANDDLLVLLGVEQVVDGLARQVPDRRRGVPAMRLEDRLGDLHPPRRVGRHPVRPDGAGQDAFRTIRDHEFRINLQARPESRAGRAGAVRRVEREAARFEFIDRRPVVRTGVALGEPALLEVGGRVLTRGRRDQNDALPQTERRFDGIGESRRIRVR